MKCPLGQRVHWDKQFIRTTPRQVEYFTPQRDDIKRVSLRQHIYNKKKIKNVLDFLRSREKAKFFIFCLRMPRESGAKCGPV
jgi:hypothetical protein